MFDHCGPSDFLANVDLPWEMISANQNSTFVIRRIRGLLVFLGLIYRLKNDWPPLFSRDFVEKSILWHNTQ